MKRKQYDANCAMKFRNRITKKNVNYMALDEKAQNICARTEAEEVNQILS